MNRFFRILFVLIAVCSTCHCDKQYIQMAEEVKNLRNALKSLIQDNKYVSDSLKTMNFKYDFLLGKYDNLLNQNINLNTKYGNVLKTIDAVRENQKSFKECQCNIMENEPLTVANFSTYDDSGRVVPDIRQNKTIDGARLDRRLLLPVGTPATPSMLAFCCL